MSTNGINTGNVSNSSAPVVNTENTANTEIKLNSIFDVDNLGNHNGKIEEEDFLMALRNDNYKDFRSKIEDLYVEFAAKHLGKEKKVGNYIITEVELPLQPNGVTKKRTIMKDKQTGKLLLDKQTTITEEPNGITSVQINNRRVLNKKSIAQNDVGFQYDRAAIEDYIINEATDQKGNKLRYFSNIPNIRNTPENERTPQEAALLKEFEELINHSIDAGIDYGMDPKFILAIIQKEVIFQGLDKSVVGKNGKGYMQLTSAPIQDFLGYAQDGKYHDLKIGEYGQEMEELLISRGFRTDQANTSTAKQQLYTNIMAYLKENKDPEFNIRLGTLVLRNKTNKAGGNITTAARNYNGSSLRESYARKVGEYYGNLQNTVPNDTTYTYKKIPVQAIM